MGRPMKLRDERTAELVKDMRGCGLSIELIARLMKLSPNTLKRLYADELESGLAEAHYQIARRLYEKAMSGDTTCLIFWCKARLGWRENVPTDGEQEDKKLFS